MIELLGALAAFALAGGAAAAAKRRARKVGAADPMVRVMKALGYDPETHRMQPVRAPRHKGVRIIEAGTGRVVRFYTLSQLKRLKKDPAFMARYAEARRG